MSGNSLRSMSHRCLLHLSNRLSHVHSVAKSSPNQQRRFFCSLHNLSGINQPNIIPPAINKMRVFSSTSSPKVGPLGWYLSKLESKPLITKSITTSLIFAAADITSQMMQSSAGSFDSMRTLRMGVYGLLLLGPSQHFWFNFLSKHLPKRDVLTTLKKILIGQTLVGPPSTSVFFSYNAALQAEAWFPAMVCQGPAALGILSCLAGESGDEIAARLKRDLLPTLMNGAMYWPFCDFVTLRFTLVHLQPLMNSSCAYLWTIYLTYIASLKIVSVD